MNKRITELRKTLSLTMDEFGSYLGVGKSTVSQLESGVNRLTERMIKLICSTSWPGNKKVNEQWFRSGKGSMFVSISNDEEIAQFINNLRDSPTARLQKRFLTVLARLSEDQWNLIDQIIDQIVNDINDGKDEQEITERANESYSNAINSSTSVDN